MPRALIGASSSMTERAAIGRVLMHERFALGGLAACNAGASRAGKHVVLAFAHKRTVARKRAHGAFVHTHKRPAPAVGVREHAVAAGRERGEMRVRRREARQHTLGGHARSRRSIGGAR